MSRAHVRALKRAISTGQLDESCAAELLGREAALALLERSIGFHHGRIAVVRLAMAAQAGSALTSQHWLYCRRVVERSNDEALRALYVRAAASTQVAGQSGKKGGPNA